MLHAAPQGTVDRPAESLAGDSNFTHEAWPGGGPHAILSRRSRKSMQSGTAIYATENIMGIRMELERLLHAILLFAMNPIFV